MLCLSGFELYSRWVPLKHSENSELKPNLNTGESGVFDRYYNDINMSKIHDCERNSSPMI